MANTTTINTHTLENNSAISNFSPWGFWSTLGLTGLIYMLTLVAITIATFIFIAPWQTSHTGLKSIQSHFGLLLSIESYIATAIAVGMVLLFARIKNRQQIKHYLGLRSFQLKKLMHWVGVLVIWVIVTAFISELLQDDFLKRSELIIRSFSTCAYPILIWLALVIAAPLGEEFIFRGFLFKGIRHSKLGDVGAILITSVLWALMHIQYNFLVMSIIFSFGIVLGLARIRTGSIWVPIILHAINNCYATTVIVLYMKYGERLIG